MRTIPFVSLVVALTGGPFGWASLGQTPETSRSQDNLREELRHQDTLGNRAFEAENLGPVERSSKLIGATVKDASGEKLGKIRDLAIDLHGGRVLQVMVARGGILGVGEKHVALPPTTLSVDTSGDVTTSVDRQKFEGAPELVLEKWQDLTGPDQVSEMYRYYQVEPRLVPRYSRDRVGALNHSEPAGRQVAPAIVLASKLVGLSVTHDAGKEVGKVSDLVIDLSSARIPAVVVSTGGFLGVGDELSAIPYSLFRYQSLHKYVHGLTRSVLRILETEE
jgi:sporulation protein YlmC with PRC-barrel domain